MSRNRGGDTDEFGRTLRESVSAGIGGIAVLLPIPILGALGAPVEIGIAYLLAGIVALGATLLGRRRRRRHSQ